MAKNRVAWLDIAKGMAIILMVLGHTSIPETASKFIYAFHMPLFFIASGWVTRWDKLKLPQFIVHRLRTLMLPFSIYSVIVLIISNINRGGWNLVDWLLNGWGGYALWFIPVLFVASIVAKMIMTFRSRYLRASGVCLLLAAGYALSAAHLFLPWNLSTVPYAATMILVGSLLKRWQTWIDNPRIIFFLLCLLLTGLVSMNWKLDLCYNNLLPIIPKTVGAIAGTLMLFMAASWVALKTPKAVRTIFVGIGRETFLIVGFSQIIIMQLNAYLQVNALVKYALLILILYACFLLKKLLTHHFVK